MWSKGVSPYQALQRIRAESAAKEPFRPSFMQNAAPTRISPITQYFEHQAFEVDCWHKKNKIVADELVFTVDRENERANALKEVKRLCKEFGFTTGMLKSALTEEKK